MYRPPKWIAGLLVLVLSTIASAQPPVPMVISSLADPLTVYQLQNGKPVPAGSLSPPPGQLVGYERADGFLQVNINGRNYLIRARDADMAPEQCSRVQSTGAAAGATGAGPRACQ